MTNIEILWIALILYVIGVYISYRFYHQLFMLVSILWLIPLTLIDNNIVKVFSVIMFLVHIIIPFSNNLTNGGDDFD